MTLKCAYDYNTPHTPSCEGISLSPEERTARLTILIDPRKKTVFERLCVEEDSTPSQVVRRLMRAYIESRTGKPWSPEADARGPRRKNAQRGARS
jgi:hypothetical protein